MKIVIVSIPHQAQRYDTTDDWQIAPNGDILMYVSETTDKKELYKQILHGLTECLLCDLHGITQQEVDTYDLAHPESDNPGEEKSAPYHKEHIIANIAESLLEQ